MVKPISQSCVVEIGNVAYWLRDRIEHTLPATVPIEFSPKPAVVINLPNSAISLGQLETGFQRFADEDDVFSMDFVDGALIYVQTKEPRGSVATPTPTLSHEVKTYLEQHSAQLLFSDQAAELPSLSEGPYFVAQSRLHQAWRLYEDDLEAFVSSSVPAADEKYRFRPLLANAYSGLHSVVAVPSRLAYPTTPDKPLNGKRISVKDLFHLQGMVTTIGSRSYAECYGFQNSTARYLQQLIDMGAVIVGKTKMGGYAGSEIPPEKCIDYFAPWNPRGDGYQGPSGSSSGAGASIAGYDWLDFALATDTTGSMRMPASAHGAWGIRVSSDAITMEGIVPSVSVFDTTSLMSRDPTTLSQLRKVSGQVKEANTKPKRIIYNTDWFPTSDVGQQKMTDQFIQALEAAIGTTHTKMSFSDEWARSAPDGPSEKPLKDYLAKAKGQPEAIVVVPLGRPGANYRDVVPPPDQGKVAPTSYNPLWFASILGLPQLVVPIGQNPYESKLSGQKEYAPIVGSIVGNKGSDLSLIYLAQEALGRAQWPTRVLTGRYVFHVGNNDRNSAKDLEATLTQD
ncbi:MAG: hypothetical protein Q9216_005808 [Gyalolechia sp. 2 TL-2023]